MGHLSLGKQLVTQNRHALPGVVLEQQPLCEFVSQGFLGPSFFTGTKPSVHGGAEKRYPNPLLSFGHGMKRRRKVHQVAQSSRGGGDGLLGGLDHGTWNTSDNGESSGRGLSGDDWEGQAHGARGAEDLGLGQYVDAEKIVNGYDGAESTGNADTGLATLGEDVRNADHEQTRQYIDEVVDGALDEAIASANVDTSRAAIDGIEPQGQEPGSGGVRELLSEGSVDAGSVSRETLPVEIEALARVADVVQAGANALPGAPTRDMGVEAEPPWEAAAVSAISQTLLSGTLVQNRPLPDIDRPPPSPKEPSTPSLPSTTSGNRATSTTQPTTARGGKARMPITAAQPIPGSLPAGTLATPSTDAASPQAAPNQKPATQAERRLPEAAAASSVEGLAGTPGRGSQMPFDRGDRARPPLRSRELSLQQAVTREEVEEESKGANTLNKPRWPPRSLYPTTAPEESDYTSGSDSEGDGQPRSMLGTVRDRVRKVVRKVRRSAVAEAGTTLFLLLLPIVTGAVVFQLVDHFVAEATKPPPNMPWWRQFMGPAVGVGAAAGVAGLGFAAKAGGAAVVGARMLGEMESAWRYLGGASLVTLYWRTLVFGRTLRAVEWDVAGGTDLPDGQMHSIIVRSTSIASVKDKIADAFGLDGAEEVRQLAQWLPTGGDFFERLETSREIALVPDYSFIVWTRTPNTVAPIPLRGLKSSGGSRKNSATSTSTSISASPSVSPTSVPSSPPGSSSSPAAITASSSSSSSSSSVPSYSASSLSPSHYFPPLADTPNPVSSSPAPLSSPSSSPPEAPSTLSPHAVALLPSDSTPLPEPPPQRAPAPAARNKATGEVPTALDGHGEEAALEEAVAMLLAIETLLEKNRSRQRRRSYIWGSGGGAATTPEAAGALASAERKDQAAKLKQPRLRMGDGKGGVTSGGRWKLVEPSGASVERSRRRVDGEGGERRSVVDDGARGTGQGGGVKGGRLKGGNGAYGGRQTWQEGVKGTLPSDGRWEGEEQEGFRSLARVEESNLARGGGLVDAQGQGFGGVKESVRVLEITEEEEDELVELAAVRDPALVALYRAFHDADPQRFIHHAIVHVRRSDAQLP